MTVTFHHKFRDDIAFEDVEALKVQIAKDLAMTREWFEEHRADL